MRHAAAFAPLAALALLWGAEALAAEPAALASFEKGPDGWTFSLGKEFKGAQGNFAAIPGDGENGAAAAWLEGAFGIGGAYTAISKELKPPIPFKGLRVKLKTSDFTKLTVRLKDSSGQVHQQPLQLKDTPDWQSVAVSRPDGGPGSLCWGGAKDGKWHDPLCEVSLLLEAGALKGDEKAGSVLIERVDALRE